MKLTQSIRPGCPHMHGFLISVSVSLPARTHTHTHTHTTTRTHTPLPARTHTHTHAPPYPTHPTNTLTYTDCHVHTNTTHTQICKQLKTGWAFLQSCFFLLLCCCCCCCCCCCFVFPFLPDTHRNVCSLSTSSSYCNTHTQYWILLIDKKPFGYTYSIDWPELPGGNCIPRSPLVSKLMFYAQSTCAVISGRQVHATH